MVHKEVELTIVCGKKYRGNVDVLILPRGVGLSDDLPHKRSVGGVHEVMSLSKNGCAMSNPPNCGGDVVGFRNVNVDEEVDVQVQREVKGQDVSLVKCELSMKGAVSMGLDWCLLDCRRQRRLQLILGCAGLS